VVIPQVAKLFVGGAVNQLMGDLIVTPNSRVVVTTGRLPGSADFPSVVSFQTNSCSGYLGASPDYRITPSLWSSCPAPRDWSGVGQMSSDCYNFINSLGACRTPKFERKSDGLDYIDGREDRLTSLCRDFVKRNYKDVGSSGLSPGAAAGIRPAGKQGGAGGWGRPGRYDLRPLHRRARP